MAKVRWPVALKTKSNRFRNHSVIKIAKINSCENIMICTLRTKPKIALMEETNRKLTEKVLFQYWARIAIRLWLVWHTVIRLTHTSITNDVKKLKKYKWKRNGHTSSWNRNTDLSYVFGKSGSFVINEAIKYQFYAAREAIKHFEWMTIPLTLLSLSTILHFSDKKPIIMILRRKKSIEKIDLGRRLVPTISSLQIFLCRIEIVAKNVYRCTETSADGREPNYIMCPMCVPFILYSISHCVRASKILCGSDMNAISNRTTERKRRKWK